MNKFTITLIVLVAFAGVAGLVYSKQNTNTIDEVSSQTQQEEELLVTMYKSPTCGCCEGHAAALRRAGYTVEVHETRDMAAVKHQHNIPPEGESCHTSLVAGYVVEGHVPLEAIEKLLNERPDIAGIGLPSMPIGTPGMPGTKTAPYEVYQLSNDGGMSPYLTI